MYVLPYSCLAEKSLKHEGKYEKINSFIRRRHVYYAKFVSICYNIIWL
jgi:uncharacterized protein YbbK (DUF523 family)